MIYRDKVDWWWLRSPYSNNDNNAGFVNNNGNVNNNNVNNENVGVSPAPSGSPETVFKGSRSERQRSDSLSCIRTKEPYSFSFRSTESRPHQGHTWKLNKKVMRGFVLTKAPKEIRNSVAGAEQPDMGGEGT